MSHVRVWKFRPPANREGEFAEIYSSNGRWAALFGQSHGYCGTSLLRPLEAGGWWMTIDSWDSLADFEAFNRQFGDAYRALDAQLEGVAGEEEFVGAFEDED